jgi:hypothetical protein
MTEISDKYQAAYKELKALIDTAFRIAINIQYKEVETRDLEAASRVFAKVISHARAVLVLAPKKPAGFDAPAQELWDLSSMATLCRSLIDSYYVFFYIAVDEVDEPTKEFRWILWDYHSESRRLKKLQLIGSTLPAVGEIVANVRRLKENLTNHPIYTGLEPSIQKRLRKPAEGIFATNSELSARAGIDEDYYKNTFMFLSSYVHSHPFSIEQLTEFRAGEDDSLNLLKIVIEYTSIYLSLTLRDFTKLVPEVSEDIDEETQKTIELWSGVVNDFSKFKQA